MSYTTGDIVTITNSVEPYISLYIVAPSETLEFLGRSWVTLYSLPTLKYFGLAPTSDLSLWEPGQIILDDTV